VTHESRGTENRVTIGYSLLTDPSGQVIQEWEDGETIWAEVKGISGRELVASGAEVAEATIRVWVRFRRDITAANRLKVLTGPFAGARSTLSGRHS
jgi:SPP1 family predicted phage head-tail adaptor